MKNKIIETNFIKSKYKLKDLTKQDLEYLQQQNIKCYQSEFLYESKYIFTSYQRLITYMKARYSRKDLEAKITKYEFKYLKDVCNRYVTTIDLIDFTSREFCITTYLNNKEY